MSDSIIGAVIKSLEQFMGKVAEFIPNLLGAIIIFIIGWIISVLLGKATKKLLRAVKLDRLLEKTDVNENLRKAGVHHGIIDILGGMVKWFFLIVTISAAIDVLNITQLSNLANQIILYIPNIIAAFLILILGLVVAQFASRLVSGMIKETNLPGSMADIFSAIAKWGIVIFAVMAALVQLNIAQKMIEILFSGLVLMLAVAGGIGLGLGSKDKIKEWLSKNINF